MSSQDGSGSFVMSQENPKSTSTHLQLPIDTLTNPHIKTQPSTGRRVSRVPEPSFSNYASKRMSVFRRLSVATNSQYSLLLELQSREEPAKKENTYKMAPEDDQKFNSARVEKMMIKVLNSYLDGEVYEPKKCTLLAKSLSDVIKSRVKDMDFERYKFVSNVVIGKKGDQSLKCASRCLWNAGTDGFASASYTSATLYCVATVYGLYFE